MIAYGPLQLDIGARTFVVVTQISSQTAGYTMQDGLLTTTAPLATPTPEFHPTENAIRVAALWHASLIISLSTASFGILVKQWLRHYMNFVTSSPRGRLRVRSFRRKGLEQWQVLGIASLLPFLLQVALLLFFVGLCYYTADVHNTVRNTTVPLVAGWSLVFGLVTILPIFSDRCPYKTPVVNRLAIVLHKVVRRRYTSLCNTLQRAAWKIYWSSRSGGSIERIAGIVHEWAKKHVDRLKDMRRLSREAAAQQSEEHDLEVIVAADTLQGNDELAATVMVEALQESQPKSSCVIDFALQILQHRIQWPGSFPGEPMLIDCQALTPSAAAAIVNIIGHVSYDEIRDHAASSSLKDAAKWTLFLYFSVMPRQHNNAVPPLLRTLLDKERHLVAELGSSSSSSEVLQASLNMMRRYSLESKHTLAQSFPMFRDVLDAYFLAHDVPSSFRSGLHLESMAWQAVLNPQSLDETITLLVQLLYEDAANEWSDIQQEAFSYILKLTAVTNTHYDVRLIGLVRSAATSTEALGLFFTSFILYPIRGFHSALLGAGIGEDVACQCNSVILYSNLTLRLLALSRLKQVIEAIATRSPPELTLSFVLALCETLSQRLSLVYTRSDDRVPVDGWRGVFTALTRLIRACPSQDLDHKELRKYFDLCYYWLEEVDIPGAVDIRDDGTRYMTWHATFKSEDSPIPDDFISALASPTPDLAIPKLLPLFFDPDQVVRPTHQPYWRLRRLLDILPAHPSTEEKDLEPGPHESNVGDIGEAVSLTEDLDQPEPFETPSLMLIRDTT